MKNLVVILSFLVFPFLAFSQNVPPEAIAATMSNTFNLYGNKLAGTCFMVTKEGKQYFVTVAHLFKPSHKSGESFPIQMVIQNQIQSFNATIFFHPNRDIDIAVLKLSEKVSQKVELSEELIIPESF